MLKTSDHLNRQKEFLLQKHPDLSGVEIRQAKAVLPSTAGLADLIDRCWAHTYGQQERFLYNPDYLQWVFGVNGLPSPVSLTAVENGEIVGIFLFTPRNLLYKGQRFNTGICSGLSIRPDRSGRGVSQYLYNQVQLAGQAFLDGLFFWYHSSIENRFSSHAVLNRFDTGFTDSWGHYHLNSRVFDYGRGVANTRLRAYEKLGLTVFSGMPGKPIRGPGWQNALEPVGLNQVEEAVQVLNHDSQTHGEGRWFTEDEFRHYALFTGKSTDFESCGYIYRKSGKLVGLAIGYVVDIMGKTVDRVFFLDCLYLEPGTDKSAFIRLLEHSVYERFRVYGMVTLDRRLTFLNGYLPTRTVLSLYSVAFTERLVKKDADKRLMPILDHK
jgi:hypothetical protein